MGLGTTRYEACVYCNEPVAYGCVIPMPAVCVNCKDRHLFGVSDKEFNRRCVSDILGWTLIIRGTSKEIFFRDKDGVEYLGTFSPATNLDDMAVVIDYVLAHSIVSYRDYLIAIANQVLDEPLEFSGDSCSLYEEELVSLINAPVIAKKKAIITLLFDEGALGAMHS